VQGQITLVPNAILRDYLRIICDPTLDDLSRCLREGRLTAWRKFSMIRNRLLIGNAINAGIHELRHALQGFPSDAAKDDLDAPPTSAARFHQASRSRRTAFEQDREFSHS
jgi:hypothetical protein